jgi:hypothetical protein
LSKLVHKSHISVALHRVISFESCRAQNSEKALLSCLTPSTELRLLSAAESETCPKKTQSEKFSSPTAPNAKPVSRLSSASVSLLLCARLLISRFQLLSFSPCPAAHLGEWTHSLTATGLFPICTPVRRKPCVVATRSRFPLFDGLGGSTPSAHC